MARRAIALFCSCLLLAACGEDDEPDTATSPPLTAPEVAPTTAGPILFDPDRCETEPDLADYGEPPMALRPCEPPDELIVQTVVAGEGRAAADGDTVLFDYVGVRSLTGEMFDNTFQRDVPLSVKLGVGGVIAGWEDGLVGAQAGEIRRLDIPAALAYGANPPGPPIEADDPLSFVLFVRGVFAQTTAEDAPLDLQVPPSVGATDTSVEVIKAGDGATVDDGNTAVIHTLLMRGDNEAVLVDTWADAAPIQVTVTEGGSLPGLIEGLSGAKVGDLRVITMPPDDAFGPDGQPTIGLPAGTDLIAVVEVLATY